MADAIFEHPRLAAVYDALEGDRDDLAAYVGLAEQLGGCDVLDLGCGTGAFALLLAKRGYSVIGVDPAAASLAIARAKPGAERVRWILGDATAAPDVPVDLATMTGNVAQAITDPSQWHATLSAVHARLRSSGYLVLETRDPRDRGWQRWTRSASRRVVDIDGADLVETWVDLITVSLPLVTFRWTWVFHRDGTVLTSDSTLRFRTCAELEQDLARAGFLINDVRDAPDRPGRELVVIAAPAA